MYHYKNLTPITLEVPLTNGTVAQVPGHGELEHSCACSDASMVDNVTLRQLKPKPQGTVRQAVVWVPAVPVVQSAKEKSEDEPEPVVEEPVAEKAPAPNKSTRRNRNK